MVVADSNGCNLAKHIEKDISISIHEVVAVALLIICHQDMGSRVLERADLLGERRSFGAWNDI